MQAMETAKLRNVAFVGHQGSGKTSLVEALLYNTGVVNRPGTIQDKNTISDWDEEERSRGMSLQLSVVPIETEGHRINILDTPGFTDFQGDVKSAMRVADAVVLVVDAVHGVEVGTELVWEYAQAFQQSLIVVINKMDRENASFRRTLNELNETFSRANFVPVTIPIGAGDKFKGVVGLVTEKAYLGAGAEREEPPVVMRDAIESARLELIEAAAETNDDYMQTYFDEGTLSEDQIREGMRTASTSHLRRTVPVFVTSATANIGTIPFLESLVKYVPLPSNRRLRIERDGQTEHLQAPQSDEGPLAAYVFKTTVDKYGTLNYLRVFSGKITANSRNVNATTGEEERFGSLMLMRGKETIEVDQLHAGDIGVVAKLNNTHTGDTIADRDASFQIVRPPLAEPLYAVAVRPHSDADLAKLGTVLTTLCNADPSLRWEQNAATGEMVLEGMGEIHVKTVIERAARLGVHIDTAIPTVAYRETIRGEAQATYRHKKQSGGAGQFGEVSLRVEPSEEPFEFEAKIFGGAISQQYVSAVEKGIRQELEKGVIAGHPIQGVKVTVFDGKEHPVDSKDIAFQIAGREAFRAAFCDAKPALLEPIMEVRVTVPEAMMGDVMSDLTRRRGQVQGIDAAVRLTTIIADVPRAEMLRFGNDLRSMTAGRGIYTMQLSHYEAVPEHLQSAILEKAGG